MDKLKFHRDKMGIHVYYTGMNPSLSYREYVLNGDIAFNTKQNAVVPEPERISTTTIEEKVVAYFSHKDSCKISVEDYHSRQAKINLDLSNAVSAGDVNAEVRAEIALRELRKTWSEVRQEVKTLIDHEFEVVDIEYPADDRLTPMRHYDDKMVGYFKVDGKFVVSKLVKELCEDAGLVADALGSTRGSYNLSKDNYYGVKLKIEGDEFGKPLKDSAVMNDFTGTMVECHEFVNKAEGVTRECFDQWIASRKYPDKFTVGEMLKKLDTIEYWVNSLDCKVKSKQDHQYAKNAIAQARVEITELANKQESSDNTEASETVQ